MRTSDPLTLTLFRRADLYPSFPLLDTDDSGLVSGPNQLEPRALPRSTMVQAVGLSRLGTTQPANSIRWRPAGCAVHTPTRLLGQAILLYAAWLADAGRIHLQKRTWFVTVRPRLNAREWNSRAESVEVVCKTTGWSRDQNSRSVCASNELPFSVSSTAKLGTCSARRERERNCCPLSRGERNKGLLPLPPGPPGEGGVRGSDIGEAPYCTCR